MPILYTYRVLWETQNGHYAAALVSLPDPDEFSRAWNDADYNGPYATDRVVSLESRPS